MRYKAAVDGKRRYYVYIMASNNRVLYTGVTGRLGRRADQHGDRSGSVFAAKYNCHKLVYFESFEYVGNSIAREKQIKRWRREKKIALIEAGNPNWDDLGLFVT